MTCPTERLHPKSESPGSLSRASAAGAVETDLQKHGLDIAPDPLSDA